MDRDSEKDMKKKLTFLTLCAMLFALCSSAVAQQSTKVPRIGFLSAASTSAIAARIEGFRHGLREIWYIEGKNIVVEWPSADGKPDRLPALAAELVRLKVDIIVTAGPSATRAAKEATSTIPIVMTQDSDPIGTGFVASLARPGGNITGLSTLAPEISGKKLELLKEIVPRLSRVAVLVVGGPVLNSHRTQIADLAAKNRLPAIYDRREYVEAGGLMSYATSITDLDRRAATYVDRSSKAPSQPICRWNSRRSLS